MEPLAPFQHIQSRQATQQGRRSHPPALRCTALLPTAVKNWEEARTGQPKMVAPALSNRYIYSKAKIEYNIWPCSKVAARAFLRILWAILRYRVKRCLKAKMPFPAIPLKVARAAIYEETPTRRPIRAISRPMIPGLIDQTIAKKACCRLRSLTYGKRLKAHTTRCTLPGRPRPRAPIWETWMTAKNYQAKWPKMKNNENCV